MLTQLKATSASLSTVANRGKSLIEMRMRRLFPGSGRVVAHPSVTRFRIMSGLAVTRPHSKFRSRLSVSELAIRQLRSHPVISQMGDHPLGAADLDNASWRMARPGCPISGNSLRQQDSSACKTKSPMWPRTCGSRNAHEMMRGQYRVEGFLDCFRRQPGYRFAIAYVMPPNA
jgi:hypothetical protein